MKIKIKDKEYEVKKVEGLKRPYDSKTTTAGVKVVYVTPSPASQKSN